MNRIWRIVKERMYADPVVFDPETVIDNATYDDPSQFSSGIIDVFINSGHVVRESVRIATSSDSGESYNSLHRFQLSDE